MLTLDEFVTELIVDLVERIEGGFTPTEQASIEANLRSAIRRAESSEESEV